MLETFSSFPVALVSVFSLIGLAEIGDKSQLVCIAIAVRYRAMPVLMGAIAAFALLNLAAVLVGAAVASWLPEQVITAIVGVLFLLFGAHAFSSNDTEEESDVINDKGNHGIFYSTFLLITLAEFGDKTQIAVAGLASTVDIVAVWLGATLALSVTSGIGVLAGRTVLQHVPITLLHRLSGSLFILFGITALLSLWW
jgi:putative Ca2+/H+ antiporter (TMEM165/GDT1 family)